MKFVDKDMDSGQSASATGQVKRGSAVKVSVIRINSSSDVLPVSGGGVRILK